MKLPFIEIYRVTFDGSGTPPLRPGPIIAARHQRSMMQGRAHMEIPERSPVD